MYKNVIINICKYLFITEQLVLSLKDFLMIKVFHELSALGRADVS